MNNFLLNGDLCQISTQKTFLVKQGFSVGQVDVYPALKKSDTKPALCLLWSNRIEGWWNYRDLFISHGICTKNEFEEGLKAACSA